MVSNVRWVRRRIGSAKVRRFVWPVAEYLEASRPVKAPDAQVDSFICVELPSALNGALLKPE
jgi:hypothetical protein